MSVYQALCALCCVSLQYFSSDGGGFDWPGAKYGEWSFMTD